ncbi:DUF3800 domain-containing protein [Streptomyces sp. Li-HN-5-11]|uniref:DUF3800 domain-containing protein n=1 Tax=Streptomyces sp. Li-HN-5-11 TaxID=3075432 RepID=UPI0028A820C3|nr:DUF3800 domain-containing protein [Streptomyces sp. Li-HN-5-11]WNM36613.1 DUF3800 domain-containing protein [Streptomyces sp. Li-HN-5-11]
MQEDGARRMTECGVLEVACDESGSDGENLTSGNTDVFAHASVLLSRDSAAGCVQEIRNRIRSPAEEYKATHLLREKHRAVLEWVLSPAGPLYGHAHVDLTEKAFFVVDRVLQMLLDDSAEAASFCNAGREAFGQELWTRFLEAANHLLRARGNGQPAAPVDGFFDTVRALREAPAPCEVTGVLERLAATRVRADAFRARVRDGAGLIPALNPLLPAIVRTAAHWSAGGHTVRLVHDQQNMLTPGRIAWIVQRARRSGAGLDGLDLVDSRQDARVQLADFLAGIARKIASDELNRHGDPVLTTLLRPYVGAASVWGDAPSWAGLGSAVDGTGRDTPADSAARIPR